MSKLFNVFMLCLVIIAVGCKSTDAGKNSITMNNQLNVIIEDYCKKNKSEIKEYKIFRIENRSPSEKNYFLYNVFPVYNDYIYTAGTDNSFSYLPTGYIEYKGEIFFIEEKEPVPPNKDLLKYLDSLHLLDSTNVKIQLGLLKEEDRVDRMYIKKEFLEGVNYVICKETPYKISKRVKTNRYINPEDEIFNVCK